MTAPEKKGFPCPVCGLLPGRDGHYDCTGTHYGYVPEPAPASAGQVLTDGEFLRALQVLIDDRAALRERVAYLESRGDAEIAYEKARADKAEARVAELEKGDEQRVRDLTKHIIRADKAEARVAELERERDRTTLCSCGCHGPAALPYIERLTAALREVDDVPYGNDGAIAAHRIARRALEEK